MVIKPRIKGFICTTAHPLGCEMNVRRQEEYVRSRGPMDGPKRALIIGASTGYGLSSRIVSAFGCGAATVGVFFERPATAGRTASAGWYNSAAFTKLAGEMGIEAYNINGDAFSNAVKDKTIALIKDRLGSVDLIVYSLASPRRLHPVTGRQYSSVLKPIGEPYTERTVDMSSRKLSMASISPATQEEIDETVAVMGGEDWRLWIDALSAAGVLAPDAATVAYSYIGPSLTHPIYKDGTIGRAKLDLEETAKTMTANGSARAYVSVNKALVTQASSAIPVVPLYISLLYRVMKDKGLHEGCVGQIDRLFRDRLMACPVPVDSAGRIRLDDLEMREDVQTEISRLWGTVTQENLDNVADIEGYQADFQGMFGFGLPGVDYDADTEADIPIPGVLTTDRDD